MDSSVGFLSGLRTVHKAEIQQIAALLPECHEAVCEWDGGPAMTGYLNRLYQVIRRLMDATSATGNQDLRVLLAMMEKKARTLKQQIEERLAVRN